MKKTTQFKNHYIAIIGGSISGSEAANVLAQNGFRVVVFDMNKLPYGKIEDGLPNWHVNLRDRQIAEIDSKLDQENIRFVPCVKIGNDIYIGSNCLIEKFKTAQLHKIKYVK